jgi:hypothetical protein
MRAEARVLDKYEEIMNNDVHWKVLEACDDYIRDQLTDYEVYLAVF